MQLTIIKARIDTWLFHMTHIYSFNRVNFQNYYIKIKFEKIEIIQSESMHYSLILFLIHRFEHEFLTDRSVNDLLLDRLDQNID